MNAQESINVMRIIKNKGYDCKFENNVVVVKDPVQCSSGGGREWTEYKDVKINSFLQAIRFIDDRE